MELHNRYLHYPTLDISILQIISNEFEDNIFTVLHRLVQFYNCTLTEEKLTISKLEMCRMILCYEYQLTFSCDEKHNDKKYKFDAEKTCFHSIKEIFPIQHTRNTTEMLVLHDIIILQMVLYCNIKSIKQHLENFLNSSSCYIIYRDTRVMYMRILESFLESLRLYQLLYKNIVNYEDEFKKLASIYLEAVKSWMKKKEHTEWVSFASMLPMLMNTFAPEYILFPIWEYTLNERNDLKESLSILSIMADTCFIDSTYIHNNMYSTDTFWLLILEGLRSSIQQYRKQAIFIMKKAIDSMKKVHIIELGLTKASITPFICDESGDLILSIDCIKQKFFLVYEALEEKQYHLVAPALTHITSLIKASEQHKFCNNCFDPVWLQCIFEKVLQHENHNIVKWGIIYICKLDAIIVNDRFLELFVNVLNNNFLYECQTDDECPEIVKELLAFFIRAEEKKVDLVNNFLKKISQVIWGPIAIFYVIYALCTVPCKMIVHSRWQTAELHAIKSLVEINLNMHSHILRTASQIELWRTIPSYIQKIDDLTLFANILATFPFGEDSTKMIFFWNIITKWMEKILTKEDAIAFVKKICVEFSCENINSEMNPKTFALMICLLHDANLILSYKTCPAEKILNNWLCYLNGVDIRPYADIHSSINIIEFIAHLLNFSVIQSSTKITQLISRYLHIIYKFLIKNMKKIAIKLTYEDYIRYVIIISSYTYNANILLLKNDINNYIEQLQNESIYLLKNVQYPSLGYLYALHILYLSQNILVLPVAYTFYTEHLLNIQEIHINIDEANLKGKVTSEYYLLLSKLLYQYLINSSLHSWMCTTTLFSNILKFFELGGIEIIPRIAMILTVIVDNKIIKGTNDRQTLEHIFKQCWKCTFFSKKNNILWTAVQNLIDVIINNNFLLEVNAIEFIAEFVDQLIEEGDDTPRFKRILLSKIEKLDIHNIIKFKKSVLNCLLHGSAPRRDKKVENYTHLFIDKYLGQYYPRHILILDQNNDTAVRVLAIVLLHTMVSYQELNYAATIMPLILELLEKYKNKRYFKDSYIHNLKHRLMQILLILEPVLNDELIILLQERLCDLILLESNQHSVRLMQEWLMIRIFQKHINLHNKLWKLFAESIEKRPGCTISVASIVYHIARLLSSDIQKNFIQTGLPYIAQCCLGQQFKMRLYNQFILIQLYELMNGNDDILEYKGIYQAAIMQQGFPTKNSIRIQDDFYFSCFHPINDYSLQTIFFDLPRLTDISCNEWIRPDVFEAFMFQQNNNHPLQLYHINPVLSETKISIYFIKSSEGDPKSLTNNVETYLEGLNDIQKKLEPSRSRTPLYNDIFRTTKQSIYQPELQIHEEGVIVVASLVSRLPNLGGISRTCEIFGVKALIIANSDHVKDKDFQCLSVSAEKWINIIEVKLVQLQNYLLEKKNTGWSLVGVEQTANSVNLSKLKFEKKTVLVLGNEKNGIPANFIPLFDMCVQIPQVGIIRSLNVHVTAAICIWQYATQYILK